MILTIIGSLGALLILIAFIMNKLNIWINTSLAYDLTNFLGSLLLVIYAILLKSYPFIVLNTIWGIVALKDTIRGLLKK